MTIAETVHDLQTRQYSYFPLLTARHMTHCFIISHIHKSLLQIFMILLYRKDIFSMKIVYIYL